MKKIIFIIILTTSLYAKSKDSCYSVQLISFPANAIDKLKVENPQDCQIVTIKTSSSIRCGCKETFQESKQDLQYFKVDYPNAIVTLTYKHRFKNLTLEQEKPYLKTKKPKIILSSEDPNILTLLNTKSTKVAETKDDNRFNTSPVIVDKKDKNKTDIYFHIRAMDAKGLQKVNDTRITNQELIARIGLRHKHTLSDNLLFDIDIRAIYEYINFKNISDTNAYIELKRLSLEVPIVFNTPLSAKIGRMSVRDKRTWWYDNQLDMLKLFYNTTLFSWDLSAGGRLSDEHANAGDQRVSSKGSKYLIAHLDYHYYYNHHFESFATYEDNGQDKNEIENMNIYSKLSWLGFRALGEFNKKFHYWVDMAYVNGKTQSLQYESDDNNIPTPAGIKDIAVSGFGFDTGGIYKSDYFGFGFGYAYGSGDSNDKSSQNIFLQPNISNNKTTMIGTTRYRYYGEMLDPQLSNINIISLYAGLHLYDNLWLEGNYHKYTQQVASSQLRASNLPIQTNGTNKDIGQEVDFILGGKFKNRTEGQLILSGFFRGDAFEKVSQKKEGYRAIIDYKIYW